MVLRPFDLSSIPESELETSERERRAFLRLRPVTPSYQTAPIEEGFNWEEALADLDAGEWYLVVFRSVRRPDANEQALTEFDDQAYAEALMTGGLLCYFAGDLDAQRNCLSFCVWRSREEAQRTALLPRHAAAAQLAPSTYEWFVLDRYMIRKVAGSGRIIFDRLDD
uniref:ABM domain-containing protein n=1 Tax=Thermorudis peleae TaxID=1382356 RepID=A0A831TEW6_9BACT